MTNAKNGLLLLVICLVLTSCGAASTATMPVAQATSAPTVTPSPTPVPQWQSVGENGFYLEIPGYLVFDPLRSQASSSLSVYDTIDSATTVSLDTVGTPAIGLCAGTPTTIGNGISAYENDQFVVPTPTPPQGGSPTILFYQVSLVTAGIGISIRLSWTTIDAQKFRQMFGPIWKHMLTSFTPPTTSVGSLTHCP